MTDDLESHGFEPMGMHIPGLGDLEILAPDEARLRLLCGKVEYCNDPEEVAGYCALLRGRYEQALSAPGAESIELEELPFSDISQEEEPPDPFWRIGHPQRARLSRKERRKRQRGSIGAGYKTGG